MPAIKARTNGTNNIRNNLLRNLRIYRIACKHPKDYKKSSINNLEAWPKRDMPTTCINIPIYYLLFLLLLRLSYLSAEQRG